MINKRSLSLGLCLLFLSLVSTGSLEAVTRDVCSSSCTYSTIQSAINAADNGDTVLVSDGTYTENIDFSGKAITVTSLNGAGSTTIDGNQSGSVVTFDTGEGSGSVLDGFKITNGSGTFNGYYEYSGGGIYCSSSSPSIVNCNITSNSAFVDGYGGGIYCDASSPTVSNCNIDNNTVTNSGGGFFSENVGSPIFNDCTINGNTASWGGGIGFYWNTGLTLNNCVISDNTAEYGGGIDSYDSTLLTKITNSIISGNTATDYGGGGIENYTCPYEITNSVIAHNSANDTSYGKGGGIYNYASGLKITVTNSILWGNTAGVSGDQISDKYSNGVTVTYSDIQSGWTGTGNKDADPLFADATNGDYHINDGSPCIDAADSDVAPATDKDGVARYDDPQTTNTGTGSNGSYYDIGAYELRTLYVPDHFSTIQNAINTALDGFTIIVRNGTYTENIDFNGKAITVKSQNGAATTVIDGNQNGSVVTFADSESASAVLDGFTITGGTGTTIQYNDLAGGGIYCSGSSPSITNCTITDNTVGTGYDSGMGGGIYCTSSSPVITNCKINNNNSKYWSGAGIYGDEASAISLTNSEVNNNDADGGWGAGFYISDYSSAIITSCSINNNTSTYYGAGFCSESNCSATIINSTINSNASTETGMGGGGIFNGYKSTMSISNSEINSNWTVADGGGILSDGNAITITACTISGNSGAYYGGGIATWNDVNTIANCNINNNSAVYGGGITAAGDVVITNSIIVENSAISSDSYGYGGGGIYLYDASSAKITNSTISSNYTNYYGGGIVADYNSSATITNSILWDDSASLSNNEIYTIGGSSVSVSYSDVEGGWSGTGNKNSDPLFLDAANDDYHLTAASPCIDSGINSAPSIPSYDFEGDPRIFDADDDGTAVADMGADEFPVIAAEVESKDDPIDVTDSGSYVDIYVELPAGNVEDIDLNTVLLTTPEGSVYASGSGSVGDRDSDGIDDIKYKFSASSVYAILTQNGSTRLTITGELTDDTPFQGSVIVTVTGN